ncbi:MAG: ABC transporter ATP-binding protein [Pseudohongiella sp.]|nr:ABC transporter ATP-binding protein [Pseudohongiella sp.]
MQSFSPKNAISIRGLTKTYANGFQALKGIDLDVKENDFFALLGPNGAGKSTIIGIISTLVRASSGNIQVFGQDVATHVYETKLSLGIVPQEINFSQFEKVGDIVITQAGYYGLRGDLAKQRAEKYLRKLDLWEKRDNRSRMLSGGMKRRLMIARALVHEPRLLILDEPTAGVDIELRRSMWEFLQELNRNGTTIILTTHYLEEAESLCRNIAIINQGQIVENTSMRKLLDKLARQTLVFDTCDELASAPTFDDPDIQCTTIDSHSFEISLSTSRDINGIYAALSEQGILIRGMRNKTNRLEELFLSSLKN